MAQVEPMDVDNIASDFDDKENSVHNSNVLPKTPSTEKGYEELDVSELNMKLRYSITPASSPMSRSYTANYRGDSGNISLNNTVVIDNNLTRSLNSSVAKTDVFKSPKLPLQALPTSLYTNSDRRSCEKEDNVTVTISGTDNDDNLSLPSTSSSTVQTPEATTPTKEIPKSDGSPIMRGLKSVLNMFRSSHSPVPVSEYENVCYEEKTKDGSSDSFIIASTLHDITIKDNSSSKQTLKIVPINEKPCPETPAKEKAVKSFINPQLVFSTQLDHDTTPIKDGQSNPLLASTPITNSKIKDSKDSSKRNSPLKESIVFNEDLERELQWHEETEIFFKDEKIPIHKLFQTGPLNIDSNPKLSIKDTDMGKLNTTVEYMDVSNANVSYKSVLGDKTLNNINTNVSNIEMSCVESDNEFVDCETTYTQNKSYILETAQVNNILPVVYQVDNIPHEACLEEYIEPVNKSININKDAIITDIKINESFTIETNNLISEKPSDESKNTEASSLTIPNYSSKPPIEITNKAFSGVIETPNSLFEFPIKDTHDDVIHNVGNIIIDSVSPTKKSCITEANEATHQAHNIGTNSQSLDKHIENDVTPAENIVDCIPNVTENSIATIQSYTQQSVQDSNILQMIIQTNNQVHESCIETIFDNIKVFKKSEIEVPIHVPNLPTDNRQVVKGEDTINLDTDDTNTTRILFEIDELLLNKIKLANIEKDIVSNNTEISVTKCKKASENSSLNTSEDYLLDESVAINETVDKKNNYKINEDIAYSKEMNEVSKMIEEFNEKTFVPDKNAGENRKLNTTGMKATDEIEKFNVQNIEVNKTAEMKMNVDLNTDDSLLMHDVKENFSVMECELHTVEAETNVEPISGFRNNHHMSYILNIEGSQDITMDSLEPNLDLIVDQPTCDINKTDNHTEVDYSSSEPNYFDIISGVNKPNEPKNNASIDLPPPLDVPLPSDDDIEKDSLGLDLCSINNNKNNEVIPKYETEKAAEATKFDINADLKPVQPLNDHNFNISLTDTFDRVPDNLQANVNSGVEMTTVENNIQNTPFGQLSTNLTSSLQVLNLDSNNKEPLQIPTRPSGMFNLNNNFSSTEIVNQALLLNDDIFKAIPTPLPDVVQAVNDKEKDDLRTQEIKSDITIRMEENINKDNAKGIDEEIVSSANSSPYVSVSNLDSNSNFNVPADESEILPEPEVETVGSALISPKLSRKGYNINFDEIENPFATKTNIRMSPPLEIPNISLTPVNNNQNIHAQKRPQNRRMSNLEVKKPDASKKRFNTSIDRVKITNSNKTKKSSNKIGKLHTEDNKIHVASNIEDIKKDINPYIMKSEVDYSHTSTSVKTSSDLGNHTVLHKSNEKIISAEENFNYKQESRSVFNILQIDDMNFNPFATKSRICVTPPPTELNDGLDVTNHTEILTDPTIESKYNAELLNATVCINNLNENATEGMEYGVQNEVKISTNACNITSSSINTKDKDVTVREVNTEDEDTIEGPFFEAEDLDDVVKVPGIEMEKDTVQLFEDLPTSSNNDDIDKGELFIDAEAMEFFLNQNKSNVVADSGKESLFLKFDPLFTKRVSSDGVLAALSSMQKKQSTPKKLSRAPLVKLAREETPTMPMAGPSNVASIPEVSNEEIISTVSKPMMVVNPAIAKQPVATPRISLTPKTNRQSLSFSSPAMVVIDRLLSLSGNTSLLDQDVTTDVNRNHEANIVLVQLRELLAEKDVHVYSLKCESKELRERLATLESQVRSLETEGQERLKKVNTLNERLAEKTKINKSMAFVVEEYERTIASLIADIEQEKKRNAEERMRLITERDEQTAHLASMEGSFSDLHSKYEKCKQIILNMKVNEDNYKKSFKIFDENLLKMQKNYDLLKQHATSKLNHANQELEIMNKAHDAEVLKLTSIIKRKDLHITSLEESLAQKSKANEELAAICDELINKVGCTDTT